jgi:hypothetical protein
VLQAPAALLGMEILTLEEGQPAWQVEKIRLLENEVRRLRLLVCSCPRPLPSPPPPRARASLRPLPVSPSTKTDATTAPRPSLQVPGPAHRLPKLVVLDLNGLLLYRCMAKGGDASERPSRAPDGQAGSFQVWLRPHAAEFTRALLEQFHVAVWSSAQLHNINPLVEMLLGRGGARKLAFVWSQAECTNSGQMHPENEHRPLFWKELQKVFSHPAHAQLYHAGNTLLVDDDAYKAVRPSALRAPTHRRHRRHCSASA